MISEILFDFLVLFRHQASVKLSIFLIKELAALLYLREISNVRLLIFANITLHDISNFNKTLVGIFLDSKDIEV